MVLGSSEPGRSGEVADVVAPDVVAALVVEAAHRGEGLLDRGAVVGMDSEAGERGRE